MGLRQRGAEAAEDRARLPALPSPPLSPAVSSAIAAPCEAVTSLQASFPVYLLMPPHLWLLTAPPLKP